MTRIRITIRIFIVHKEANFDLWLLLTMDPCQEADKLSDTKQATMEREV